ncbi:MAG TPA: hypothetical protein DD414_10590 [Lachnospiraceae bacterium]|nr:hypothetical protein [Lachnospiraceae bacterium]
MKRWVTKIETILPFVIIECFLVYGVCSTVCETAWPASGQYWNYFLYILYAIVLIKVLLQRNSRMEWLLVLSLTGLAELSRITTQTNTVLWFVCGVVIARNINPDTILKADFVTRFILGLCLIILPIAGLYPNQADVKIGGRFRDSFGWAHPNEMGLFFLMFCIIWLYFRHDKWSWKDTAGMLPLVVFLDYFANSRTSEICIIGLLVLEGIIFFLRKRRTPVWRRVELEAVITSFFLVAGCLGTLVLITITDKGSRWFSYLPQTVSERLKLAHNYWAAEGFSVAGQIFDNAKYTYLDILYPYLALNYGIIILLLFLILNGIAIWRAYKTQDEKMLLILLVFLIYSLLEHEHFKILSGFYPVLLGHALWSEIKDQRSGKNTTG